MCFNGICLFSELCLIFRLPSVRPEGKNVLKTGKYNVLRYDTVQREKCVRTVYSD